MPVTVIVLVCLLPRFSVGGSNFPYEVILDRGTLYIDANDGRVLYNGTGQQQASFQQRGEHDDDHEHESGYEFEFGEEDD